MLRIEHQIKQAAISPSDELWGIQTKENQGGEEERKGQGDICSSLQKYLNHILYGVK